jgi:glutamate N-acetyltransferase/amino-acid N-acetyltransferase
MLPKDFLASGVAAGIKTSGDSDIAVILSKRRCSAAGVFTQNRMAAAPVQWDRALVPSDRVRAVVINAGNANAATGAAGFADAKRMAEFVAQRVACEADQVLIASTGVIGRRLPMDRIELGINAAIDAAAADETSFANAARAIMTTDTRPKVVRRALTLSTHEVCVYGFCKGAAMIGPNMATMLAFVLVDTRVGPGPLQGLLAQAVEDSFNCISVEGHTSTNDTVLALAQDDGRPPLQGEDLKHFGEAVREVCIDLARAIVDDAEGCTHTIVIDVEGCRDRDEAKRIAQTIANDALVKTAIHGADPNWGRIVSAAGRAGADFDPEQLLLWVNGTPLFEFGSPLPFDAPSVSASLRAQHEVTIRLSIQPPRGQGSVRCWTSDLTAEYVRLNADYTT